MRKFLIKTFIFLLPIILFAVTLEVLLRKMPNDYKLKKEYLDKNADKIEVLILGSSHSFYGVNPKYLGYKSFNAGYVSQSLKYDMGIIKHYSDKMDRLKAIVLPISYFSLFSKLELGNEKWRVKNYCIYYGICTDKIEDYFEILGSNFDINLQKINSYYFSDSYNTKSSTLGWGKNYNSDNQRNLKETGRVAAKRHTASHKRYFVENVTLLESIISFCRSNDVKLILFTPPASKFYYNHLEKEQLELTTNKINEIDRNNLHVKYFNWLNENDFTSEDYFDADHLNEVGAKKLSILINEQIENTMTVLK